MTCMSITRDQVAHLARLSRLALTSDELEQFAGQLDVIIGAVARVQEVAAVGIPPTTHVAELVNVFRDDVVVPPLGAEVALAQAPAAEVATAHLDRIAQTDVQVRAFLHVATESALAAARAVDDRRAAGERLGPLAGGPLALKDLFTTVDMPTTCGSAILAGWRPPYDSTITRRLRGAGVVILGKTNMDEFAMGSSTENSAFGPSRNPWDLSRVPGGSSGGSAAAVAAYQAPLGIGTDTGGSIRQPAAVCGLVGVKPTYGGSSRYGVVAFASSLDTPGPLTRTVLDAALLHEVMSGHDPRDSTSCSRAA